MADAKAVSRFVWCQKGRYFHFLITIINDDSQYAQCVVDTHQKREGPTHPKSGSDVKTDNAHKPRKHEKVYYLHSKAFQEKQSKPLRLV